MQSVKSTRFKERFTVQQLEDLKLASQVSSSKSGHDYYILNKYEVLQCGDVEKLIKKRSSPEDPPIYYVCIKETHCHRP